MTEQGFAKPVAGSIPSGRWLRLREDVYKEFKEREWIFNKVENDLVFLIHVSKAYGIAVGIEDIDWSKL